MASNDGSLWPVYEFRPLSNAFPQRFGAGPLLRYADGEWIEDDGEYDLAFARGQLVLMVEPPYQRNIIWKWLTGSWRQDEPRHPRGNPWHHMLRDGETEWGGNWGRDRHPNARAGDHGMKEMCARYRSASGLHVEFHIDDPHIIAGLVRERNTKRVLVPPIQAVCMYCGEQWRDRLQAAE